MTHPVALRWATGIALLLAGLAALAGLFWSPPGALLSAPDLYGQGLYRRDTSFVAGASQGADLLSLVVVIPAALWAVLRSSRATARIVLIGAHAWLLYMAGGYALGAVAFNEAFPLYVALIPASAAGLVLALNTLGAVTGPRGLAVFLIGCGLVTGLAWSFLLWLEMSAGAYPPATYYTVRTTYALDLGVIAPGCLAAGLALRNGWSWWPRLAVPLLGIAALLLPMMVLQTGMQLRAGVTFGPEAAVPFFGFGLVSTGAVWALWRLARTAQ